MRVVPRAEIDRRWRDWRTKRVNRARKRHESRLRNLGLVVRLVDGRTLAFRGRQYHVPPVPWPLAIRILDAEQRMDALGHEAAPRWLDWLTLYRDVGRLFKACVTPTSRVRRWLWPATPNPMRKATPSEVGEALRFFSMCVMMDHAESQLATIARRGISQATSPPSSPATRNGATRESPKAGSTSSWA